MLQLVRAGARAWLRPKGCRVRPGTEGGVGGQRLEGPGIVSHSCSPFTGPEGAGRRGSAAGGETRTGGERG